VLRRRRGAWRCCRTRLLLHLLHLPNGILHLRFGRCGAKLCGLCRRAGVNHAGLHRSHPRQ
jgi:hypothetical protein